MWKTLVGRCIYKSPSGIRVFQNPLFRWLQFQSEALQTVLNRYFPQYPGLNYINPLILPISLQPADSCMLGLGGAGAAHALSAILPQHSLTIVEVNQEVIDIATRYFMLQDLRNLNLIHQDANLFVHQCQTRFQYLLVDLFTADAFPKQCNSEDFFAACKRRLKPGGVLAVNLANRHEQWPIFQLIKEQFSRATLALPVPDCANMIVFAQASESINTLAESLKKKGKIHGLIWDTQWGCIGKLR